MTIILPVLTTPEEATLWERRRRRGNKARRRRGNKVRKGERRRWGFKIKIKKELSKVRDKDMHRGIE